MLVKYNQNNPVIMGSWLSTGWDKLSHAQKVNKSNLVKGAKKAYSATKTNVKNADKIAGKIWDYTPSGILVDAITGKKNPVINAVKVNAKNAVKAAKKISMNKIVDSLTPETGAGIPETPAGGGIMKYLPIVAAGIGALTLLMGN